MSSRDCVDELDQAALRRFLARVSYKPGYRFDAKLSRDRRHLVLHMRAELPDATGRKAGPIPINLWNNVPQGALKSPGAFMNFLHRQLQRFENHEIDEWLKLDGNHVRRPQH